MQLTYFCQKRKSPLLSIFPVKYLRLMSFSRKVEWSRYICALCCLVKLEEKINLNFSNKTPSRLPWLLFIKVFLVKHPGKWSSLLKGITWPTPPHYQKQIWNITYEYPIKHLQDLPVSVCGLIVYRIVTICVYGEGPRIDIDQTFKMTIIVSCCLGKFTHDAAISCAEY